MYDIKEIEQILKNMDSDIRYWIILIHFMITTVLILSYIASLLS